MALEPEHFHSSSQALNTIRSLETTPSYWKNIVNSATLQRSTSTNETQLQTEAAILLYRGKLKLYKISPAALTSNPEKNTLQDNGENKFTFLPVSSLLVNAPEDVKTFSSKENAAQFLLDLNPDIEQLRELSSELGINEASENSTSKAYFISIIGLALASGDIIIAVKKPAAPQTSEEVIEDTTGDEAGNRNAANDTPITTGSQSKTNNENKKENKKPDCIYKKLTLTCRHGRAVTLDPAKALEDGKVTFLEVVSSKNEELKEDDGTLIFEILTVDTEIEDVCSDHQTNFITIGDDKATLIGSQTDGKLAKFKAPSKEMLEGNGKSILKYLWLPNVKKDGVKSYNISANASCDFSQFDKKETSIKLYVYPFMKWNLNFNVNLGSIKNDGKPSNDKIAFGGTLKLQQDNNKADEFSGEYKNKLAVFEKTLNHFQKIITDNILDKFKDGRDIEIDVKLPKLAIAYDTQFKEKKGSHLVIRTHEFNFEAAPFINIKAGVDILPIIVLYLASWWARPFNAFFDWVKQKYGEMVGKEKIKAGISFKVSIEGELRAKFTHKRDENEKTTTEGEPVKSKIIIKAEGEAKMDGHVYVLKVEVLLKAGVESSIEIGLSLGSEDISKEGQEANPNDAPFVALDFMFNGVKVYLEKEIQVSLTKKTKNENNTANALFGAAPDETETPPDVSNKEAQKYEKVWLEMSNKHQFKYYLNKDDREEIKAQKALEKERLESENTT